MLTPFIPLAPVFLYPVSLILLWQGRKAILTGNWFRHKNLMLPAAALVVIAMALTFAYLVLERGNAANHLVIQIMLILHLAALSGLAVLLPLTLYRIARHLVFPHKTMARLTVPVWALTGATGFALNSLWIVFAAPS